MSPKDDYRAKDPQKINLERDHLRNVKLQQAHRMRKRIQEAGIPLPSDLDSQTPEKPDKNPNTT